MTTSPTIGAVVIGRNEGARLVACLHSVACQIGPVVYVDSGSTDESVARAKKIGVEVVELDISVPFTAARARNAGFDTLRARHPGLQFVQFIDGDCVLQPGWLAQAARFLTTRDRVAVVCGRRRERFPAASVYNRLCDREWDTPLGQTRACGGDALMRLSALKDVGGFDDLLIAGEEPELCVRLRKAGWDVWRLDAEMTLHDAGMTRFRQWWLRSMRGGHAWADGMALHGSGPERLGARGALRALAWAVALPVATLGMVSAVGYAALLMLLAYPAQVLRLANRSGPWQRQSWESALFLTLAKFPEAAGVLGAWLGRIGQRRARLIEYK